MRGKRNSLWMLPLAVLLAIGVPGGAGAQAWTHLKSATSPPASRDPAVISRQISLAIRYAEEAKPYLLAQSAADAVRSIYSGYVQARAAHAGIDIRISRANGFPDPRLTQASKTMEELRYHLRTAMSQAERTRRHGQEAFHEALEHLDKALALLRQVQGAVR